MLNPILLIGLTIIVVGMIVLGVLIKKDVWKPKKGKYIKDIKSINLSNTISTLNESKLVNMAGSKFTNGTALELLFRKAKNPWNLTPATYNFIRYGLTILCVLVGLLLYFIAGWFFMILMFIIGALCFLIPKLKYNGAAKDREHQWNQLYQFMWVIKHNASLYDPKKVFNETALYIDKHAPQLNELREGFKDFADHWNGKYADDYIKTSYECFDIPKELYTIMLVGQQTGEFPEKELGALRTIIISKMDYAIKDTLSMTATQATLRSTPFLLVSMGVIILIPTLFSVFAAFAG